MTVIAFAFEAEDIARGVEALDLAPAVAQEAIGADRSADDLVNVFGRRAFAVDFLVSAIQQRLSDEIDRAHRAVPVFAAQRWVSLDLLDAGLRAVRHVRQHDSSSLGDALLICASRVQENS